MRTFARLSMLIGIWGFVVTAMAAPTFSTLATATGSSGNDFVSNAGDLTATANVTGTNGVASASANAGIGSLHGSATVTGCGAPLLFQQICNGATSYTQFNDLVSILGSAVGAPVSIEFDWTVDGTVDGTGAFGFQSALAVGNLGMSFSDGSGGIVETFQGHAIGGSKSLIVDTSVGSVLPIEGWLSLGAFNRYCASGGQSCNDSLAWSIVVDASHTARLTAQLLTQGLDVQLIGDSGYDYLAANGSAATVAEPSDALLIGSGVIVLAGFRRRRSFRTT